MWKKKVDKNANQMSMDWFLMCPYEKLRLLDGYVKPTIWFLMDEEVIATVDRNDSHTLVPRLYSLVHSLLNRVQEDGYVSIFEKQKWRIMVYSQQINGLLKSMRSS